MSATPHNIAVVGLGNIGQAVHAPLTYQNPRSLLWGVSEPRSALALKVLDHLNKTAKMPPDRMESTPAPHIYENFDALLKDEELEAAILCVPHELHIPMATQLLEEGKVVFCEKPLCTTSDVGRQFLDWLVENHCEDRFMLGYMWRWDPAVQRLHAFIDEEMHGLSRHPKRIEEFFRTGNYDSWLGKFRPITVRGFKPGPEKVRPAYLHSLSESLAYEWLINVWSHQSNLTQYLLGAPRAVRDVKIGVTGGKFSFMEDFGDFTSDCQYAWTRGNHFYRGIRIFGENSSANLELQVPLDSAKTANLEIRENGVPVDYGDAGVENRWMYATEFERFLDLLDHDYTQITAEDNRQALGDAVRDIQLAENVIKSHQQGAPVSFSED